MKKMFKRTTAIAASALMVGQMVPFNVFAEPATVGPNSLTIHPYVLTETKYKEAKDAGYTPTGKLDPDEDHANIYDAADEADIVFNVVQVGVDGQRLDGGYSSTAAAKAFTNLPNGYYKVTPANNDTDARFVDAESFFVQLPSGATGETNTNVHVFPKLTDNNDTDEDTTDPSTSGDKHSIKLTKTLSDPDDTWTGVGEAKFDIYYKDTLGKWVNVDETNHFTTTNGVLKVDGLPLGTYYAVEVEAPTGYLLDQTPVVFTLDGTAGAVQLADFVNDKKLTANKEIAVDGQGEDYNWTITTDIPSKPENLVSYIVTDEFTGTLKNVQVGSVKVGTTDVASTKYTVTSQDGKVIVTITDMTALAGGSELTINIKSEVGDDYTSGAITNSASLKYQYAYDPDPDDDIPDDIPGIEDPVPYDPDNPSTAEPDPIDTDTANDSFTPATIKISNVDSEDTELEGGVYEITGCSEHKDSDDDGDGNNKIVTLANLAPGHYKIEQKATASGYLIDSNNPKYIYIDKNGDVFLTENETATEGTKLSEKTIVFTNEKTATGFELPFTGSTATIVFTIAGIGVMGGALFFFIFFKKRDKDEEEQENA